MMTIDSFQGEYRWLSNFHPIEVEFDDVIYPTTEHAYQAAKTTDTAEREQIRLAATPGKARRLGQKVTMRPDWDDIKRGVMLDLTIKKFRDPWLREQLVLTGKQHLVEGNTWGDTFWGVHQGNGLNHLGRILMDVRDMIVRGLV